MMSESEKIIVKSLIDTAPPVDLTQMYRRLWLSQSEDTARAEQIINTYEDCQRNLIHDLETSRARRRTWMWCAVGATCAAFALGAALWGCLISMRVL